MKQNVRYHYFVEGECEKKIVDVLKENGAIISGKSMVFNPVQNLFNMMHIRPLSPNTIIVMIFDTDTPDTQALSDNLRFLKKQPAIRDVICVPQVRNLEEEIIRSTNIKTLREFFGCKRDSEFKQRFLEEKHLMEKLKAHHFDLNQFWSRQPDSIWLDHGIRNQADRIRQKGSLI